MARAGGVLLAIGIRSVRRGHWLAFFAAVLIGWALLFRMAIPGDLTAWIGFSAVTAGAQVTLVSLGLHSAAVHENF